MSSNNCDVVVSLKQSISVVPDTRQEKHSINFSIALVCLHLNFWMERMLARKIYEMLRRQAAALRIQKNLRTFFARKSYLQLQESAVLLQAGLRSMSGRKEFRFRMETKAAILIQWRGYREYAHYKSLMHITLMYQCAWRQSLVRRALRQLKMAARETSFKSCVCVIVRAEWSRVWYWLEQLIGGKKLVHLQSNNIFICWN